MQNKKTYNEWNFADALQAIRSDDHQWLQTIAKDGMAVNYRSLTGSTLAHAAAYYGHVECLKILIECGADLNIRNKEGAAPADLAKAWGNFGCTKMLNEHAEQQHV